MSGWQLRAFHGGIAALMMALSGCGASKLPGSAHSGNGPGSSEPLELRIGCQKSSLLLNLMRANGRLQARLGPEVIVTFKEFPAGPQMLEALNVGSVDFGHAGETPPVFAQAAGVPLVYAACEQSSPQSEAILVPTDSTVRSVADLKGKRVALNKGSNVHHLLVRALEAAGLTYEDVQAVFLSPADARVAFENQNVDAWVIWDPYFAAVERAHTGRILVDGKNLVENRGFYLSTRVLATEHAEVLQSVIEELATTSDWVDEHREESVVFLAELLGMDRDTIELAEQRRFYGVQTVDADIAAGQQRVADTMLRIGLIPRPITVAEVFWKPLHSAKRSTDGNVLVPTDTR